MKFIYSFALPALAVFYLTACSPERPDNTDEEARALQTAVVSNKTLPLYTTVIGNIVSDHRVEISSKISAYILGIEVVEGENVQTGQLLVTLDDEQIQAAITQARSALSSAKKQLADAEEDLKRYEILLAQDSVSQVSVRKIRLLRDTARNQLNSASAALSNALSQRDYSRIKSPVKGVVVSRQARKGDLAKPGIPILSVESREGLLFQAFMPEQHINLIASGDEVSIDIDSLPSQIKGTIIRIVPSADPITRRVKVEIAFSDEVKVSKAVIPGMFGRSQLHLGSETLPVVPNSSLLTRGGLEGVFVLDEENRARFRWLRLGRQTHSVTQVVAGLTEGETVLLDPPKKLPEGALVSVSTGKTSSVQELRAESTERQMDQHSSEGER